MKTSYKHVRTTPFVEKFWRDVQSVSDLKEGVYYPLSVRQLSDYATLGATLIIQELPQLTPKAAHRYMQDAGWTQKGETPEGSDDDRDVLGFIYAAEGFGVIFLREESTDPRKLFTLSHELGHFYRHYLPQLQRQDEATLSLFSSAPSSKPRVFSRTDVDPEEVLASSYTPERLIEIEANAFAAELLMPTVEVQATIKKLRAPSREEVRDALISRFHISRRAAEIRLDEFGVGQSTPLFAL